MSRRGKVVLVLVVFTALVARVVLGMRAAVARDLEVGSHEADGWLPLSCPLLWRWATDPSASWDRRVYAVDTFYHRSVALSQGWLQHELQANPSRSFVSPEDDQWAALGMDDPQVTRDTIRQAFQALDQREVETQFAGDFLLSLARDSRFSREVGHELVHQLESRQHFQARQLWEQWKNLTWDFRDQDFESRASALAARLFPERSDWYLREARLDALCQHPEQALSADDRLDLLDRLRDGPVRVRFLRSQLHDPVTGTAAAVYLWMEGYDSLIPRVRAACDHDLRGLGRIPNDDVLCLLTQKFPKSRLAQGCHEYAVIRGQPYFYQDPLWEHPKPRPLGPSEEARRWRQWLARYPDHPGADDAGYWLGRCLEWQGQRLEALKQYADLLANRSGDGDMGDRIWQRFLVLLDVGTEERMLRDFLARWPDHPMQAAVRYALAVHLARQQRFSEALAVRVYLPGRVLQLASSYNQAALDLVSMLADQRSRWQAARQDSGDVMALARRWASWEGWKMSYLALWNGQRAELLSYDDPDRFCDVHRCPWEREGFREANSAVITLGLLQQRLDRGPDDEAMCLRVLMLEALHSYTQAETRAMVPLPGFAPADRQVVPPSDGDKPDWDWLTEESATAARALQHQFPHSRYTQRALYSLESWTQDQHWVSMAEDAAPTESSWWRP